MSIQMIYIRIGGLWFITLFPDIAGLPWLYISFLEKKRYNISFMWMWIRYMLWRHHESFGLISVSLGYFGTRQDNFGTKRDQSFEELRHRNSTLFPPRLYDGSKNHCLANIEPVYWYVEEGLKGHVYPQNIAAYPITNTPLRSD